MLDLCFHHDIIQPSSNVSTTGPKHKCVASALIKSKTSSNDVSFFFPFVSFQTPAKIKVPPWGIPWQSCVGIDVNLGILKAHEQVGSCLEKGQCLLQHRCSTTITWWGLRLFVSGASEAVPSDIIQHHFESAQYQRTKVHVVAAGPFATYLICCLAKSYLPAAAPLVHMLFWIWIYKPTCAAKCRLDLIIPTYERHVHIYINMHHCSVCYLRLLREFLQNRTGSHQRLDHPAWSSWGSLHFGVLTSPCTRVLQNEKRFDIACNRSHVHGARTLKSGKSGYVKRSTLPT